MDKNSIIYHPEVDRLIDLALAEDGVQNDLTTKACLLERPGAKTKVQATVIAKSDTVACCFPLVRQILKRAGCENTLSVSCMSEEGTFLKAKTPWMIFEGSTADLLRLERTILNFLIRACGIATYTKKVVDAIAGTNCKVLHTRKTVPGHRRTDIYACLVGGAHAHRRSLDDAILVKENHIRSTPSFQDLVDGINLVRDKAGFVEVEVTDFIELKYSLLAKPNRIMLDNFSIDDIKKAVNLFGSSVEFEASGNITLENARTYAETGVDYISMGSLTHSAPAADLSMLFQIK